MHNQFIYNGESIPELRDILLLEINDDRIDLPIGEILVSEERFQNHWIMDTSMVFGWEIVIVPDPLYFQTTKNREKKRNRRKSTKRFHAKQKRLATQNHSGKVSAKHLYGPWENKSGLIVNTGRGKRSKQLKRLSNKRVRQRKSVGSRGQYRKYSEYWGVLD